MEDQDEIVKCECGAIMRQRDWEWHWFDCKLYNKVPVSEFDKKRIIRYEHERFR